MFFRRLATCVLVSGLGSSATALDITNTAYVSFSNEASVAQPDVFSSTTFTVTAGVPPSPPGNLVARTEGDVVRLAWTPSSAGSDPVSAYRIFRATYPGLVPSAATHLTEVAGASTTLFGDSAVVAGVTYYYLARAVSVTGIESGSSNLASARAGPAGDVRVLVRVYDASGRLIRVLMDRMMADALGIERVGNGDRRATLRRGEKLRIVLSDGTILSWDGRDDGGKPVPNGIYVVKATSIMPDGRLKVASSTFSLTRPYEKLIESAVLVPNPARGAVWISYSLASTLDDVSVKIYAVSGELVYKAGASGTTRAFSWNLKNMRGSRVAPGFYVVVVEAWDSWTHRHDRAIMKLAVEPR